MSKSERIPARKRSPSIFQRRNSLKESTILWDFSILFCLVCLPILIVLALVDQTLINGEPRWLKPIKFFASVAIYNLTLEWILRVFWTPKTVSKFNKIRTIVGIGGFLETLLITMQAARGVQSHFNTATAFDTIAFASMGIIITIVVLAAFSSVFFVWRNRRLAPPIITEAIVYGLIIMTIASFQGFSMTSPTAEQLDAARQGHGLPLSGSHWVGTPPTEQHQVMPLVGWSRDIGDLRIPHFIGLHSLQFLLILAIGLKSLQRKSAIWTLRLSAALYGGVFVYTLLQALLGASLI